MTAQLEKVAKAIGEAEGVILTEGQIRYRAAPLGGYDETVPQKYERLARAALQSLIPASPELFTSIGYRGLNRTRDTSSAATAAFEAYIRSILSEAE